MSRISDASVPLDSSNAEVAGFTLIETLMAFAILALTLTVVFGGITRLLAGGELAEQRRLALRIAQSKLDEFAASAPGALEPEAGRTADGFRWRLQRKAVLGPNVSMPLSEDRVLVWIRTSNAINPDVSLTSLSLRRAGP